MKNLILIITLFYLAIPTNVITKRNKKVTGEKNCQ